MSQRISYLNSENITETKCDNEENKELQSEKEFEREKNGLCMDNESNLKDPELMLTSLRMKYSKMQKNYFSTKKELVKVKSELSSEKAKLLKRAFSKNNLNNSEEKLNLDTLIIQTEISILKQDNLVLKELMNRIKEESESDLRRERRNLGLAEDEILKLKKKIKKYEMKYPAVSDSEIDSLNSTSYGDLSEKSNFLQSENESKKNINSNSQDIISNIEKLKRIKDLDEIEYACEEKFPATYTSSDSELWGKRIQRTSIFSKSSIKQESCLIDLDLTNDEKDSNLNVECQLDSEISLQNRIPNNDQNQINLIDEPIINDGKLQLCNENLEINNNNDDKAYDNDVNDNKVMTDVNSVMNKEDLQDDNKIEKIEDEAIDILVFSQYLNVNNRSVSDKINHSKLSTRVVATLMKLNKEIEDKPKFLEENDLLEGILENLQKFGRHKMVVDLAKTLNAKYFKGGKGINLKKINKVEKSAAKIEIKHTLSKEKQELVKLQQKWEHYNQKRRDSSGVEVKFVKLITKISNIQSAVPLDIDRLNHFLKLLESLRFDPIILLNNSYALETLELCTKCDDENTGHLARHIISKNKQLHKDQMDLNIYTHINNDLVRQQKYEYEKKKRKSKTPC